VYLAPPRRTGTGALAAASTLPAVIEIIGVPFDLCGARYGSRLGPAALRLAGISGILEGLGFQVQDAGDVPIVAECAPGEGIANLGPLVEEIGYLRGRVEECLSRGSTPLVMGGEHTIAIGAIAAALAKHGPDLAVLWIDAHADLNTPATSPSGNLHGMPLAALLGLESGVTDQSDGQWRSLLDVLGPERLQWNRIAWFGLREVDDAERDLIPSKPEALAMTMHDIDRHGLVSELMRFDTWMRALGAKHLWISFDVDALDPILAPGTGTAVRGGLTYREAHLCAEVLREFLDKSDCPYQLAGLDLVETNPLFDTNNETAKMAVEWIASLFGKTILGKR
jgi:arginase